MKQAPLGVNKQMCLAGQFEAIEEYMKAHLSQDIGLEEVASGCFMSISKLSLIFRKHKGCSPIAHFNTLRIKEAQKLILTTSMSMTEISKSIGFASPQYFTKIFKKNMGVTPTQYAKNAAVQPADAAQPQ